MFPSIAYALWWLFSNVTFSVNVTATGDGFDDWLRFYDDTDDDSSHDDWLIFLASLQGQGIVI
jgi:hypothetical protein